MFPGLLGRPGSAAGRVSAQPPCGQASHEGDEKDGCEPPHDQAWDHRLRDDCGEPGWWAERGPAQRGEDHRYEAECREQRCDLAGRQRAGGEAGGQEDGREQEVPRCLTLVAPPEEGRGADARRLEAQRSTPGGRAEVDDPCGSRGEGWQICVDGVGVDPSAGEDDGEGGRPPWARTS